MAKKVVRVHFMDDSFKAFGIDPPTSADQLRGIILEKLDLKEDSCFTLFERKGDWERCLEPDEKPVDLMKTWVEAEKLKKEGGSDPTFLFKKKIFLKEDEKELQDTVAKNLVYIQALRNVIDGTYPCGLDECLKLAAYQVQIVYGDHNPANHVLGFLTQNLKNFVPIPLWPLKKPNEWELAILKDHAKIKGKSQEDAKTDYLNTVKSWPHYGTTFFPPCKSQGGKVSGKVIIGVNYEGIRLFKPKTREQISEHLFTEICSWASSSTSFAFEFGNQTESTKYTLETKHGAIIASTIQTYIDILVQMLKNGDEVDEEESQTGTSSEEGDD